MMMKTIEGTFFWIRSFRLLARHLLILAANTPNNDNTLKRAVIPSRITSRLRAFDSSTTFFTVAPPLPAGNFRSMVKDEGGAAGPLLVPTEGASSALCSPSKHQDSLVESAGVGLRVPLNTANCAEAHATFKDGSAEDILGAFFNGET